MTDRLTDIYESSNINLFNDDIGLLVKDVINELLLENCNEIDSLKLSHIDRAIYKYRRAKEMRPIYNTHRYFKACILSAIKESWLDEPDVNT